MKARDSQRQKVYNAEDEFFAELFSSDAKGRVSTWHGEPSLSLSEVAEMVNILATEFEVPMVPVRYKRGGYATGAKYMHAGEIVVGRTIPPCVVVHEFAHHLTYVSTRRLGWADREIAGHGPEFVRCYADAVAAWYGTEVGERFETHMRERVKMVAELVRKPDSSAAERKTR